MKKLGLLMALAGVLASCGGDDGDDNPSVPACNASAASVCTVIGDGTRGYRAGRALKARLYLPQDVLFGPDERLYVVDWNNHRIRAAALPNGELEDVVGSGYLGDGAGEPSLEADLNHPTGLIFDPQGRMLIAAWHNSKIKSYDPATGILEDACGTGGRSYVGDGGPARTAVLDLPASIALHDGELFILDQANQSIRKVDATDTITRVAGQCVTVGPCGEGEVPVDCPSGSGKRACLETTPDGCSLACKPAYAEGTALEIHMNQPFGQQAIPAGRLAFGPDDRLYFADTGNHMIRAIDLETGEVSIVAGRVSEDRTGGVRGNAANGVDAVGAELDTPIDLEIAPDGTVYFTDMGNSCIRAIRPDGKLSVVAGICGQEGFSGDGKPPLSSKFNRPYGLTLHDGSLYVADTHNHRVRRVVLP